MPIEKFRSLDEAAAALKNRQDVTLAQRIEASWGLGGLLSPNRPAQGVRKFRSIEEAQQDRRECHRQTAANGTSSH